MTSPESEWDARATRRLGKTTAYHAKKEHECVQCLKEILPPELYVTYSAVRRFTRKKGTKKGMPYVGFAYNARVHLDCMASYVRENEDRFIDRKAKLPREGKRQPGSGRKPLNISAEAQLERTRIMQYISLYRKKLVDEIESGGPNIERYERKLGEWILAMYESPEMVPNASKHTIINVYQNKGDRTYLLKLLYARHGKSFTDAIIEADTTGDWTRVGRILLYGKGEL